MDGVRAAAEIMRLDIPVVYVTAHSDEETRERALRSNPYGYILKPIRDPDLAAVTTTALGRAAEQRAPDRVSFLEQMLACLEDVVAATDPEARLVFLTGLPDWSS